MVKGEPELERTILPVGITDWDGYVFLCISETFACMDF